MGANSFYNKYIKRTLDFVISGVLILVFSPIILCIAVLVRLQIGNPVIFKQERPGLNEHIFTVYKFRTMTNEKDSNGNLLPDEQRLTKLGRVLRSTSLDELPELFNILNGDMSIIGPRPLLVRYLPFYTKEERLRHSVRPGLTGLAQINGRNAVSWNERFEFDCYYAKRVNFFLDIRIFFKTIQTVLKKDGILVGDEQIFKDLDEERKLKNGNPNYQ